MIGFCDLPGRKAAGDRRDLRDPGNDAVVAGQGDLRVRLEILHPAISLSL